MIIHTNYFLRSNLSKFYDEELQKFERNRNQNLSLVEISICMIKFLRLVFWGHFASVIFMFTILPLLIPIAPASRTWGNSTLCNKYQLDLVGISGVLTLLALVDHFGFDVFYFHYFSLAFIDAFHIFCLVFLWRWWWWIFDHF